MEVTNHDSLPGNWPFNYFNVLIVSSGRRSRISCVSECVEASYPSGTYFGHFPPKNFKMRYLSSERCPLPPRPRLWVSPGSATGYEYWLLQLHLRRLIFWFDQWPCLEILHKVRYFDPLVPFNTSSIECVVICRQCVDLGLGSSIALGSTYTERKVYKKKPNATKKLRYLNNLNDFHFMKLSIWKYKLIDKFIATKGSIWTRVSWTRKGLKF